MCRQPYRLWPQASITDSWQGAAPQMSRDVVLLYSKLCQRSPSESRPFLSSLTTRSRNQRSARGEKRKPEQRLSGSVKRRATLAETGAQEEAQLPPPPQRHSRSLLPKFHPPKLLAQRVVPQPRGRRQGLVQLRREAATPLQTSTLGQSIPKGQALRRRALRRRVPLHRPSPSLERMSSSSPPPKHHRSVGTRPSIILMLVLSSQTVRVYSAARVRDSSRPMSTISRSSILMCRELTPSRLRDGLAECGHSLLP
mmetsp:Transcript_28064/g.61273  ORF Transcript_28064/g.61273 Transcript_28064/m.61273 type:complete len:254 (-) Transcript_28064:18-779(-)